MVLSTADYYGVLVTIETDLNSTFSDVNHAEIMVKDGDDVKFKRYSELKNGDEILNFDTTTNELITTTITNVNFRFDKFTAYILDFEELDLFLTLEETENQSRYGLVTHNFGYDCYFASTTYVSGPGYCFTTYACTSGSTTKQCGWNHDIIIRCSRYPPSGFNYSPGVTTLNFGNLCNNQKSDIQYKENIHLVGVSNSGLNIYEYNYKNKKELYQGVIAQELIGTNFENALSLNIDGLYEVDYNKIDVEFKKLN